MYDFAEAISLGVLLRSDIPEAMVLSGRLSSRLLSRHQLPAGHWVTRVYRGGIRHTTPYLRWPQAQLFLAVTNLLAAAEQRESVLREKEAVDGAGFAEPVTHPQGA